MTRNLRAKGFRAWFDERSLRYRPTPFAMDWLLLVLLVLGLLGWGLGWVAAVVSSRPELSEVGLFAGVALAVTYQLAVSVGTFGFWLYDRKARAVRRRVTSVQFEKDWADSAAAAFRVLGQTRVEDPEPADGMNQDLWQLADDRPRAVIMEAFARLDRLFATSANPAPTAAARAYTSLRQLQQLAVLHEFEIPPRKAREFLYLSGATTTCISR
jgi:hypothetical protein